MVGGDWGLIPYDHIQMMNPTTKQCTVVDAKYAVRSACACSVDGTTYITGGLVSGRATDRIKTLINGRVLDFGVKMSTAHSYHCMVACDHLLFIIGGFPYTNTCEVVDVKKKTVRRIASMQEKRYGAAVALMNNKIFVTGGSSGSGILATTECYNIDTDTWAPMPTMTTARYGHCAVAYNNTIVVIGGRDTNSIESFNMETQTWAVDCQLPAERFASSVVPW